MLTFYKIPHKDIELIIFCFLRSQTVLQYQSGITMQESNSLDSWNKEMFGQVVPDFLTLITSHDDPQWRQS